jgi:hypothetical protein
MSEYDAGSTRALRFSEEQPNELQDGGLACSRAAREDDAARHLAVTAVAGFHEALPIGWGSRYSEHFGEHTWGRLKTHDVLANLEADRIGRRVGERPSFLDRLYRARGTHDGPLRMLISKDDAVHRPRSCNIRSTPSKCRMRPWDQSFDCPQWYRPLETSCDVRAIA